MYLRRMYSTAVGGEFYICLLGLVRYIVVQDLYIFIIFCLCILSIIGSVVVKFLLFKNCFILLKRILNGVKLPITF